MDQDTLNKMLNKSSHLFKGLTFMNDGPLLPEGADETQPSITEAEQQAQSVDPFTEQQLMEVALNSHLWASKQPYDEAANLPSLAQTSLHKLPKKVSKAGRRKSSKNTAAVYKKLDRADRLKAKAKDRNLPSLLSQPSNPKGRKGHSMATGLVDPKGEEVKSSVTYDDLKQILGQGTREQILKVFGPTITKASIKYAISKSELTSFLSSDEKKFLSQAVFGGRVSGYGKSIDTAIKSVKGRIKPLMTKQMVDEIISYITLAIFRGGSDMSDTVAISGRSGDGDRTPKGRGTNVFQDPDAKKEIKHVGKGLDRWQTSQSGGLSTNPEKNDPIPLPARIANARRRGESTKARIVSSPQSKKRMARQQDDTDRLARRRKAAELAKRMAKSKARRLTSLSPSRRAATEAIDVFASAVDLFEAELPKLKVLARPKKGGFRIDKSKLKGLKSTFIPTSAPASGLIKNRYVTPNVVTYESLRSAVESKNLAVILKLLDPVVTRWSMFHKFNLGKDRFISYMLSDKKEWPSANREHGLVKGYGNIFKKAVGKLSSETSSKEDMDGVAHNLASIIMQGAMAMRDNVAKKDLSIKVKKKDPERKFNIRVTRREDFFNAVDRFNVVTEVYRSRSDLPGDMRGWRSEPLTMSPDAGNKRRLAAISDKIQRLNDKKRMAEVSKSSIIDTINNELARLRDQKGNLSKRK